MKHKLLLIAVLLLVTANLSWGQAPQTISYQGVLTNTDGNPVADGNANLTFHLYESSTSGTAIWQETQEITLSNGVFK